MSIPTSASVHPIVILSVVDQFQRIDTGNRVAGVLLGTVSPKGEVDVTNSFAVPFEEDKKDDEIWFLDHGFVERMFALFKKVNSQESIVGWYTTGPKLRHTDINIHETFRRHVKHPVYMIIDVKPTDVGLPVSAYIGVEEIQDEQSKPLMTFVHIPSSIESLEVEEVGVEHLLRDIKDATVTDLNTQLAGRQRASIALAGRLADISEYLQKVIDKKLPINHQITYLLQDIFNLLPGDMNEESKTALNKYHNDVMLTQYMGALFRASISLHNLISNKISLRSQEQEEAEMRKLEKKLAIKKKEVRLRREQQKEEEEKKQKKEKEEKENEMKDE